MLTACSYGKKIFRIIIPYIIILKENCHATACPLKSFPRIIYSKLFLPYKCNLLNIIGGFSHLLICGDFNYPGINWSLSTSICPNAQLFLDTIQDLYLHQHVSSPTRYRLNVTPSVLDLIFTNEKDMITDLKHSPCRSWFQ